VSRCKGAARDIAAAGRRDEAGRPEASIPWLKCGGGSSEGARGADRPVVSKRLIKSKACVFEREKRGRKACVFERESARALRVRERERERERERFECSRERERERGLRVREREGGAYLLAQVGHVGGPRHLQVPGRVRTGP
jgi:hypothetical protein